MANTADTSIAGKIVEVTFTDSGADWNYSTDCGFDEMYVKSIIWHPSGADDILVVNEGGVDGPSIVHWQAYADLISNGGFASATTGWTAGASAVLASVTGGQSGNCLRITENGEIDPNARQTGTTIAGKPYEVSFYVKQGDESTWSGYLYGANLGATYINPSGAGGDEATSAWVKHPFAFMALDTATSLYFKQKCAKDAGTYIHFDTVILKELPINKQINFGDKGVPLKPYIDISDCTFSDITATKIIFILE